MVLWRRRDTVNKHQWHVWGVLALDRHIGVATALGSTLSRYLLNFYTENIIQNAGLDDAQAGIKTARRNISNLRYADDTTLTVESEELKSL